MLIIGYKLWTDAKVYWVTRLRKGAIYELVQENIIKEKDKEKGVISDQEITLGHKSHSNITRVKARLIKFYDREKGVVFSFITNSTEFTAYTITQLYKKRWQIELLFKRLKQNFPLQYFLGDNENAIRIQIWCLNS